jgi:hypothetical protein
MVNYAIQINGQYLDLSNDTTIILEYAPNDFASVESRSGIASNDFTVPLTSKNKSLLNANQIDGILYINNDEAGRGFFKVNSKNWNDNSASLTFYSSNTVWFDAIRGLSLRDLDLSDYNHDYTLSNAINQLNNTKGVVYPFINYGLSDTASAVEFTLEQDLYPAIYIKTLVESIFNQAGFVVGGSFLDDVNYKRLILPFSQQDFQYIDIPEFTVSGNASTSVIPTALDTLKLAAIESGLEFVSGNTIVNNTEYIQALNLSGTGSIYLFDNSLTLEIWMDGVYLDDLATRSGTSTIFPIVIDYDFNLPIGSYIEFKSTNTSADYLVSLFFTVKQRDVKEILEGSPVLMNQVMPDIQQLDLIKYLIVSFNLIVSYSDIDQKVTLTPFREIYNNLPTAYNWSSKIDVSRSKELNYRDLVENYGQVNTLTYEASPDSLGENFETKNGYSFGYGLFTITDSTIETDNDIYDSPFASTFSEFAFLNSDQRMLIPSIRRYAETTDTEPNTDPLQRILLCVTDLTTYELVENSPLGLISISAPSGGQTVTSGSFSWFFKPLTTLTSLNDFINSLAYGVQGISNTDQSNLLADYWSETIGLIQNSYFLRAYLELSAQEVRNFDFSRPVYLAFEQFTGYYFVSSIEDFDGKAHFYPCNLLKIV